MGILLVTGLLWIINYKCLILSILNIAIHRITLRGRLKKPSRAFTKYNLIVVSMLSNMACNFVPRAMQQCSNVHGRHADKSVENC